MNIRPKIRAAALLGALAAVAATAWATNESISNASYVPAKNVVTETTVVTASEPVAVIGPLSPSEAAVPASEVVLVPIEERSVVQTGIIIQERRLSEDERIQAQVM